MRLLTDAQIAELPKLEQSAMIDLYTIDLSGFGGDIYHLCNQLNEKGAPIVFDGVEYQPYPILADGFAINSRGASTRPTLTLSNMYGLVTAVVEGVGIIGAKVTRKQVYAKHLDAVNFNAGNHHADPNAVLISLYIVETLKSLNRDKAVLELAVPAETDGLKIPRRVVISNTSPSAYKGSTGVLAYRED